MVAGCMWPLGQSFGSDSFSFFSLHCRERKERAFLVPNVRSCRQKLVMPMLVV